MNKEELLLCAKIKDKIDEEQKYLFKHIKTINFYYDKDQRIKYWKFCDKMSGGGGS